MNKEFECQVFDNKINDEPVPRRITFFLQSGARVAGHGSAEPAWTENT
jgi:hypothetical protein